MIYHNKRNSRSAESVAKFWGKSLGDRDWYKMSQDDDGNAIVRIYDVIGWPWVTADEFMRDLDRIEAEHIKAYINTPGGDVFDGTAIYNGLKNHSAKVTTIVEGIAASMGSIITLAGDEVQIADNAYFMIHNPWAFMAGDYRDFRKEADLLERIGNTLAQTYVNKTGKDIKEINKLMDDESWFIGGEAVDFGFADITTDESDDVKASFDTGVFMNAPTGLKNLVHKDTATPSERELEKLLTRDAGLSRSAARALLSSGYTAAVKPGADFEADLLASIQTLNNTMKI